MILLSGHAVNNDVDVLGRDSLGAGVLQGDGQAAAPGHVDNRLGVDVEQIAYRSGGNDSGSAVERLPGEGQGHRDRPGGAARSDGDIGVGADPVPGAALVGNAPEGDDPAVGRLSLCWCLPLPQLGQLVRDGDRKSVV